MIYAVADLRDYLEGDWRLERALVDLAAGRVGAMTGVAAIIPAASGLIYCERGTVRFGGFEGPGERRYLYQFQGRERAIVRFADGREFHRLDLSAGLCRVRHRCGGDLYQGVLTALGPAAWRSRWTVRGPRKHQLIRTRYRRI